MDSNLKNLHGLIGKNVEVHLRVRGSRFQVRGVLDHLNTIRSPNNTVSKISAKDIKEVDGNTIYMEEIL